MPLVWKNPGSKNILLYVGVHLHTKLLWVGVHLYTKLQKLINNTVRFMAVLVFYKFSYAKPCKLLDPYSFEVLNLHNTK